MKQTHTKNTSLLQTIRVSPAGDPHCLRTVVFTSLNIILQIPASAHLLRCPIVMNMKRLTI